MVQRSFSLFFSSLICFTRVVSQLVEFVPVLQQIFAQQLRQKLHIIHFEQGMTMVDPFTHRMKAVTAKQPSAMESATPY